MSTSGPSGLEFDVTSVMEQAFARSDEAYKMLKHVNIIVAGRTGVGKSTLINAVFGEDVAEANMGTPVTQTSTWYKSKKGTLRILDTKGIEAKDFQETLNRLQEEIEAGRRATDVNDQIHIAWLCIDEPSLRVQDAEIDVVRILNQHRIPVIVVLTKHGFEPTFREKVREILLAQNTRVQAIIPVSAASRSSAYPVMGVDTLVRKTHEILPEAAKAAFLAAQRVSNELRASAAEKIVYTSASAAAAAAATPVPFSDAVAIIPIQLGMIVAISRVFGIDAEKNSVMTLVSGIAGALGMAVVGRWAAGSLVKFIPGVGSILGGIINSTVAGGLTVSLGLTYIKFLSTYAEQHHRLPTSEEIGKLFPSFFDSNKVKEQEEAHPV